MTELLQPSKPIGELTHREALEQKYLILHEREKRACENSLEQFTRSSWHIIEPGTKLIWNWHLSTVCGYLEAFQNGDIERRLIINIPPGTLKSILVSVMFPAWQWIKYPERRYLTVTNEQGLAVRDALRMKQIIASDWFQQKWPLAFQSDQNEKTLYANEKRGFRQSQGITGATTGKRGDCVVGSTLISTEIGDIRIDQLINMDVMPRVLSFNHNSEIVEFKSVLAKKEITVNDTIHISTVTSDIICTPNHTIYTSNGYVKAENIEGCRVSELQKSDNDEERKERPVSFMLKDKTSVLDMQESFYQRLCRACKEFKKKCECNGFLQQKMQQASTQSSTYYKKLLAMWKRIPTEIHKEVEKILLSVVQKPISISSQNITGQGLSGMWGNDGYKECEKKILYNEVQKQSAFRENEGQREFPFQGNNGCRRLVYKDEAANKRKGHKSLFDMWRDRIERREAFTDTSYRRKCREQSPIQSDNSLYVLPYENTQISDSIRESVARIASKDSCGKIKVYDIQVEGNSNFFANGILVHNCLIIDDPVDAKQAFSDVIRQGVNDTFDQTLSTRLNDPNESGIILIMQRLHEGDLSGHLLKKVMTKWTNLVIPMKYEGIPSFDAGKDIGRPLLNDPREKKGELLFPDRFNAAKVAALAEDLGEYGFAGQMQQRPVPSGGGIIKSHWWRMWPDDQKLPLCDHQFLSYDTAFSEKDMKAAAYSAMTRWGVFWHEQRERYCLIALQCWYERVGYDELRKQAQDWDKEFDPDCHLIEKKATGITLIQDMRRAVPSKIRSYCPGKGEDKVSRAHSVSPMFQSGLIYVADKKWASNNQGTGLIDYVSKFPTGEPPSADLCFISGTMVATNRGQVPIELITCKDKVLTPMGWRKVRVASATGIKEVISNIGLTGTRSHPVFTFDKGYINLDTVTQASTLLRIDLCSFIKIAFLGKLSSTEGFTEEFPSIVDTLLLIERMGTQSQKGCMLIYGDFIVVKRFLMGLKFTILMVIRLTTIIKILSAYLVASIGNYHKTEIESVSLRYLKKLDRLLLNGIDRKKAGRGIEKMLKQVYVLVKRKRSLDYQGLRLKVTGLVTGVVQSLSTRISGTNTADQAVKAKKADTEEENQPLLMTSMQEVYNLSVDYPNCYFANEILVHNCDTVTQACLYLRNGLWITHPDDADYEESEAVERKAAYG